MANARPTRTALNRLVRVKGELLPCITYGDVENGRMHVRIDKNDLELLRDKFNWQSEFGSSLEAINYMEVFAPVDDILKSVTVYWLWERWEIEPSHKLTVLPRIHLLAGGPILTQFYVKRQDGNWLQPPSYGWERQQK